MTAPNEHVIYTIGQGQRIAADLLDALRSRGVQYLFDVRRIPLSPHAPDFARGALSSFLSERGIVYVSSGADLGGGPDDHPDFYDDVAGFATYKRLMYAAHFGRGIKRLILGARTGRVIAIFCSEAEPERCHRSNAIGRALETRGIRVLHIDADNIDLTQADVLARSAYCATSSES